MATYKDNYDEAMRMMEQNLSRELSKLLDNRCKQLGVDTPIRVTNVLCWSNRATVGIDFDIPKEIEQAMKTIRGVTVDNVGHLRGTIESGDSLDKTVNTIVQRVQEEIALLAGTEEDAAIVEWINMNRVVKNTLEADGVSMGVRFTLIPYCGEEFNPRSASEQIDLYKTNCERALVNCKKALQLLCDTEAEIKGKLDRLNAMIEDGKGGEEKGCEK